MASAAAKAIVVVVVAGAAYLYWKSRQTSAPYAGYYLNDDGTYYVDSNATYGEPQSAPLTSDDIAAIAASGEVFPAYLYFPPGTPIEMPADANLSDLVNAQIALSPGTIATGAQLTAFNDQVGSWLSCAEIAPNPAKGDSTAFYAPVGIVGSQIRFGNGQLLPVSQVVENYNNGVYDQYPEVKEQVETWVGRYSGYLAQGLTTDPGTGITVRDPVTTLPLEEVKSVMNLSGTQLSQLNSIMAGRNAYTLGGGSVPSTSTSSGSSGSTTTQLSSAQKTATTLISSLGIGASVTPLATGGVSVGSSGSGSGSGSSSASRQTSGNYGPKGSATGVSMSSGLVGW
ncbi:MAG: hypothetical protein PHQ43_09710 [Dehalococcoidales bacterium]|nr:hypothetical protein [Dehalococcoidales bacterium]